MFRRFGRSIAVTATALLFACGAAAQTPPAASATLAVSGNVAQPLTLTVDDLKRYPSQTIDFSPRAGAHAATSTEAPRHYRGVLLRDVVNAAKPTESKPRELRRSYVLASASDGYEVVFSWAELFVSPVGDGVYVVYERDGAPLADDEGRIALISLTDRGPARHVKWLRALTLRAG